MRKFYSCSVGEKNTDYIEDNLDKIIANSVFRMHKETTQIGNYNDIATGDILILKYGGIFIAYGETTGRIEMAEEDPWTFCAPVKEWCFFNENITRKGVGIYGLQNATYAGAGQMATVKRIKQEYAIKRIREINQNSELFKLLEKEINMEANAQLKGNIINVLEHKKQIILQGPPGTGKTYLAKQIAEELIKPKNLGNPSEKIDDFFRSYNSLDPKIANKRLEFKNLLSEFYTNFPKERIKDFSLKEYCTGTGEHDNFCWWIERGLITLGYYFPGSARSFLIYWKRASQEYSKHGFVRMEEDDDIAMSKVAELLHDVILHKNFKRGLNYFGDSFLLKVLNTYYPDEFFPINSVKMIENCLKLFKIDYVGLNPIEKNQKLNSFFLEKKREFNQDVTNYEFSEFLFKDFSIKTEIKIDNKKNEVLTQGEEMLIQFHPSYTYEDFVRGIVANTSENGGVLYAVENKVLADFAKKAQDNLTATYILIIDEINRANLPSVLGELIYALEYRDIPVESMYELEGEGKTIVLPSNLFIIGTMNTADRSVGHIDYAIRRRFAFVDMLPDRSVIENVISDTDVKAKSLLLFDEVAKLFHEKTDNADKIPAYLSPDFKTSDVQVGHSYFLTNKVGDEGKNELKLKLEYEIKPILREYVKDGILKEDALAIIESLKIV